MAKITTATAERLALLHHGTKPASLTPNAVLMVAQADMTRKRKSCFLKAHVKDAKKPSDILKAAKDHHQVGIGSSNVNTARVYSDPETLEAAYALAIERQL